MELESGMMAVVLVGFVCVCAPLDPHTRKVCWRAHTKRHMSDSIQSEEVIHGKC
jgi:hypothetical protein